VMKEGDDFPQGGGILRKEDHQAFIREFIFEIKGGKHQIVETVRPRRRSSRRTASSLRRK
jgi:hypothetical protein